MPLNDPVPSTAADVLERNVQDFDRFVVSTANTFVNRLGVEKLTITGINDVVLTGNPAVQAAQQAIAAKNEARLYAEAAATNADWVYPNVSTGEAERTDGDYFWVVSADDSEVLELWRMGAVTATDTGKRTISKSLLENGIAGVSFSWEQGAIAPNGSDAPSGTRIRTIGFTEIGKEAKAVVDTGYELLVVYYDENHVRVGDSGWVTGEVALDEYRKYYRLVLRRVAEDAISVSESKSVTVQQLFYGYYNELINDKVGTVLGLLDDGVNTVELTWELGGIDSAGDDVDATGRLRTLGFTEAGDYTTVLVDAGYEVIAVYYDDDFNRIDSSSWTAGQLKVDGTKKYYRLSLRRESGGAISERESASVSVQELFHGYYNELIDEKLTLNAMLPYVSDWKTKGDLGWESGALVGQGQFVPSSTRIVTDFQTLTSDATLITVAPSNDAQIYIYTYDSNYDFIGRLSDWSTKKTTLLTEATYFRVMAAKIAGGPVSPSEGDSLVTSVSLGDVVIPELGYIDLSGKAVLVDKIPEKSLYKNGLFFDGQVYTPTFDYFDIKPTKRLTNDNSYSAWAQDKCFIYKGVVYAFYNKAVSHGGQADLWVVKSYDYGETWEEPELFLDDPIDGRQVVSFGAGADENGMYMIVRFRGGRYIVGKTEYFFYYKLNDDTNWSSKPITFHKVYPEVDLLPTNYHGFCKLPDGSLAFGYFFNTENGLDDGQAQEVGIIKSSDLFNTWTTHIIPVGTGHIEPGMTVVGDVVYGTLRGGYGPTTEGKANKFWVSYDNCETFTFYDLPYSVNNSNVTIDYVNGKLVTLQIHRYTHGAHPGEMIYGEADVLDVETKFADAFKFYRIGRVTPQDNGGSGVPSGVPVGDHIIYIYSTDEVKFNGMPNMFATKMRVYPGKQKTSAANAFGPVLDINE